MTDADVERLRATVFAYNRGELRTLALYGSSAARLLRMLRAMPAGALGTAGSVTHYDRREAHIASVASMCVDLEEAMKKEVVG